MRLTSRLSLCNPPSLFVAFSVSSVPEGAEKVHALGRRLRLARIDRRITGWNFEEAAGKGVGREGVHGVFDRDGLRLVQWANRRNGHLKRHAFDLLPEAGVGDAVGNHIGWHGGQIRSAPDLYGHRSRTGAGHHEVMRGVALDGLGLAGVLRGPIGVA